jgi:hypothetical protein
MVAEGRRYRLLSAGAALVVASGMMGTAFGAMVPAAQPQDAVGNGAQGQPTLEMVAAQAELKDGIHAKKAKQGDLIRARITEKVKLPDGRELPVDTILEGHVDQVQPSENKSDSMVAVTFDKARLKGGEELPIKATLLSMWEPQEAISGGGAPLPGGQTSQSGMGPAIPSQVNVVSQGRQAVPGVKLHSDLHDKSSVTFTATRRNLDVPPGTQMRFGMVVIPAGMKLQQ